MTLNVRSREASSDNSPARQIVVLGFPILIGALSELLSGLIDTAMIGHYSAVGMVAVAGALTVLDVFASIVVASAVGHQILAARFAGRGEPAGMRRSLRASAWFCGPFAVSTTIACCCAGGWLTGLVTGPSPQLRHIAAGFLLACGPSLLFLAPFVLLTATCNAVKRPQFAMVGGIVINLVNLVLDWLLIYHAGLGVVGSGLATTISWTAGVGFMAVAAHRFGVLEPLRAAGPVPDVPFTTSIPRLAWPAVASAGLDYASIAIFFAIVAGVGGDALGGGRVAFELMVVLYGILAAFGAAGRVLVGRAAGADDLPAARALWRAGQRMLLVLVVPATVVMVGAPRLLAVLFTSFPPVLASATPAIRIVGACLPLMAWTIGSVAAMKAFGKTRWDMYANLFGALLVQLPVGWLLADVAGLGVTGAFLGVVGYWAARGVAAEIFARRALRTAVPPAASLVRGSATGSVPSPAAASRPSDDAAARTSVTQRRENNAMHATTTSKTSLEPS